MVEAHRPHRPRLPPGAPRLALVAAGKDRICTHAVAGFLEHLGVPVVQARMAAVGVFRGGVERIDIGGDTDGPLAVLEARELGLHLRVR